MKLSLIFFAPSGNETGWSCPMAMLTGVTENAFAVIGCWSAGRPVAGKRSRVVRSSRCQPEQQLLRSPYAGPRTLSTSPNAVLSAVSPPAMSVQSESITTHTNGKLS